LCMGHKNIEVPSDNVGTCIEYLARYLRA
jgi:hypothetical protein